MNARARQLLKQAHQAYLKRDEGQRRGYNLEQQARTELNREQRAKERPVRLAIEEEMQ